MLHRRGRMWTDSVIQKGPAVFSGCYGLTCEIYFKNISSICTYNSPFTFSFSHLFFFSGIHSVYQKCQHVFHPGFYKRIFLGFIDNLLPSLCSNVVFRIAQMHSKLVFSNSATALRSLGKALQHCHSFRRLPIREAVWNKLGASLLFSNYSRSIWRMAFS